MSSTGFLRRSCGSWRVCHYANRFNPPISGLLWSKQLFEKNETFSARAVLDVSEIQPSILWDGARVSDMCIPLGLIGHVRVNFQFCFGSSWLFMPLLKRLQTRDIFNDERDNVFAQFLISPSLLHGHKGTIGTIISTRSLTWTHSGSKSRWRITSFPAVLVAPGAIEVLGQTEKNAFRVTKVWAMNKDKRNGDFWSLKNLQRLLGYLAVYAESS